MRQMECCSEENIRLVQRNVTLRTPSLDASAAAVPNVRAMFMLSYNKIIIHVIACDKNWCVCVCVCVCVLQA